MALKENLDELMDRKMDRGEFLKLSAITLAGVIGIARFIGSMNHSIGVQQQGYGSGTYGGAEDRANYLKKHQ